MQTTNSKPFAPVALVQAQQYDPALIDRAVERLLELLNIPGEWFCGKRVLIKPNLLMRRQPQEATTTHPLLIKSLADWLYRAKAAQVIIADSPGGLYTPAALRGIYQTCGMQQAAEQSGAVLNFDVGYQTVSAKDACICREFNLIHPVVQADLILSVGKLKTHCMTGLSGGVKNLFGCIPGLQKPQMHYRFQNTGDFCSMLVDLAQTVAPVLTIIDAVDPSYGCEDATDGDTADSNANSDDSSAEGSATDDANAQDSKASTGSSTDPKYIRQCKAAASSDSSQDSAKADAANGDSGDASGNDQTDSGK